MADAIAAAHAKGIVHRDLKPDNVFLLSAADRPAPGEVKVLDFGLAKLLDGSLIGGGVTVAGSLIGSPAYMSPEQCRGEAVDHRCDVYSLGCVIFEMISGRAPFAGQRVRDVLAAHVSRPPPSLSAVTPHLPAGLVRLVERMLCKELSGRPQSMGEAVAALAAIDVLPPVETAPADATRLRPIDRTQPPV